MADNVTLDTLTNLEGSSALQKINANFNRLAEAFDAVLWKDGREAVVGNLDFNGKGILNLDLTLPISEQLEEVIEQRLNDAVEIISNLVTSNVNTFVASGGQTEFILNTSPLVTPLIYANGTLLTSGTTSPDFSFSGNKIIFSSPRDEGDVIIALVGQGSFQPTVLLENVVGLPAYIKEQLTSRQADLRDLSSYDPAGNTDMAAGFSLLLQQSANAKVPLYASGGKFRLESPVNLPRGVDIRGTASPSFDTNFNAGTVFHIAHGGKGFIDVGGIGGVLMSDLVFMRDQPAVVTGSPWVPNDHDFDIYSADMSDFHGMRLYHMNSTRGIYMNGNRNRLTDWCGQFYKRGLQVDWSYDTLRVVGNHAWPFFKQADEVRAYMQNNLQLYRLGRVDNPMFVMPFSIWAKYCFYIGYFAGDGPAKPAGTVSKLKLIGADLDIGQHAYYVAPEANGHTAKFSAVTSQGMSEIINAAPLMIEGPNTKIVGDFSGSGVGGNLVRLEASAAGSELSLLVTGNDWNRSGIGFAAVEVVPGGGHISVLPGSVPLLTNGNGGAISSGNVTVWTP